MRKLPSLLITTAASALALASGFGGAGCSSSKTMGGGGATIPLTSTDTGFVQDATSGIVGAWYAYGDSVGSGASVANGDDHVNSDCVLKGGFSFPDQCSQIASPDPGKPFPPTDLASSEMCTWGTAALVMNKGGSPDYSDLWGAGIGLDFNNPGGDAGVKGYFDLSPYKGISFDFSAAPSPNGAIPAKSMRVNFPFMGQHATDSPYWDGGGDGAMSSSPLAPPTGGVQHVEVDWDQVGGPLYLTQQTPPTTPPAFNDTAVQAIQFQVFTNANTATPYGFCVANLALVKKTP